MYCSLTLVAMLHVLELNNFGNEYTFGMSTLLCVIFQQQFLKQNCLY